MCVDRNLTQQAHAGFPSWFMVSKQEDHELSVNGLMDCANRPIQALLGIAATFSIFFITHAMNYIYTYTYIFPSNMLFMRPPWNFHYDKIEATILKPS